MDKPLETMDQAPEWRAFLEEHVIPAISRAVRESGVVFGGVICRDFIEDAAREFLDERSYGKAALAIGMLCHFARVGFCDECERPLAADGTCPPCVAAAAREAAARRERRERRKRKAKDKASR